MNTVFSEGLDALRRELLTMSALVEEHVHRSVRALHERNLPAANIMISADTKVDIMEIEVEKRCLQLLRSDIPSEEDLRHVVAILKINADLERIGDLAGNIAFGVAEFGQRENFLLPPQIQSMTDAMLDMVRTCLDSYTDMDSALARNVLRKDTVVDNLNREIYTMVKKNISIRSESAAQLINLLSVARHIERIADYATNIAENVIFIVEGRIVRHEDSADSAG